VVPPCGELSVLVEIGILRVDCVGERAVDLAGGAAVTVGRGAEAAISGSAVICSAAADRMTPSTD
jgi:uncharacterized protein (DUF39 family)